MLIIFYYDNFKFIVSLLISLVTEMEVHSVKLVLSSN